MRGVQPIAEERHVPSRQPGGVDNVISPCMSEAVRGFGLEPSRSNASSFTVSAAQSRIRHPQVLERNNGKGVRPSNGRFAAARGARALFFAGRACEPTFQRMSSSVPRDQQCAWCVMVKTLEWAAAVLEGEVAGNRWFITNFTTLKFVMANSAQQTPLKE